MQILYCIVAGIVLMVLVCLLAKGIDALCTKFWGADWDTDNDWDWSP